MDSQMDMLRYEVYKDSGVEWLGEIPVHWNIKRLKYIGELKNGSTPSSGVAKYWDGNVVWIAPTDINNVTFLMESARTITEAGHKSCGTNIVPTGSIIITCRAPIGKVVMAGVDLCTNQGCKSLVPSLQIISKYYYYCLSVLGEKLNSLGTGTTFLELSSSKLKDLFFSNTRRTNRHRQLPRLQNRANRSGHFH